MKVLVLLNKSAGTLSGMKPQQAQERIARGFTDAEADVDVRFVEPRQLQQHARDALSSDVDAIIAGGGDGTLNSIANAIADGGKAFGVLPLGTLNHFAKELNVPLDLDEAIRALARGRITEVPIAEVNGHAFLNFSAIGLHPQAVEERDRSWVARSISKTLGMLVTMVRLLTRLPVYFVRLSSRGHTFFRRTPSVIVCNNPYQMRAFGVESASVPERGLLNVYVADTSKSRRVVGLLFQAMFGLLRRRSRHFTALALPELRVDSWGRKMRVSVDGEVMTMRLPLEYRIRPRPLRVLVPRKEEPK